MDIDLLDYAILTVITESDDSMWKKAIRNELQERGDALPGDTDVSVQTIGRRIDALHDNAYIESCIVSPEELRRDLIIAYKLTEDGRIVKREKESKLLTAYALNPDSSLANKLDTAAIKQLLIRHHNPSGQAASLIREQGEDELRTIVQAYQLHNLLDDLSQSDVLKELEACGGFTDKTATTRTMSASWPG